MSDLSAYHAILSFLDLAHDKREELLEMEKACAGEEFWATRNGARSLMQISRETGLPIDQVRQMLKDEENQLMHRIIDGGEAREDLVLYGLKKNREGQLGWEPGIDF